MKIIVPVLLAWPSLLQFLVYPHSLLIAVALNSLQSTELTTDPAHLVSSKGYVRAQINALVDPNSAYFKSIGDITRFGNVSRPY